MVVEAHINSTMLRWARRRSFARINDASNALNVRLEKLEAWEKGELRPTFRQAQDLAKKLKIPFGYLYLSDPPDEKLPLPDLRTKSGSYRRKPSPDFLEVLYDAQRKQDWYHDYLEGEQSQPVPFVGRFNVKSPVKDVAEDISRALRLDESLRRQVGGREEFLRHVVRRAENAGVLVMRSGIVGNNTRRSLDPEEFQGFAISDDLAPLVFINQNDFLSAQIFTLAHEFAHIWMGLSGVSNLEYLEKPEQQHHSHERATDAVAAEILVPATSFTLRWEDSHEIEDNIERLSRHYRVSRFVILRRAYDLNRLTFETFREKYAELISQTPRKGKGSRGGGGYASIFSRSSNTIASALIYSVLEGKGSPKEAAQLLNVRISKLRGLEQYWLKGR